MYPPLLPPAFSRAAGYLTSQKFSGDLAEVEILRKGEPMTVQIE